MEIVLKSSSPRRKELLTKMGYKFEVKTFDVDETFDKDKSITDNVKALGLKKASVNKEEDYGKILIGCDTIVYFDNQVYGKPKDYNDAYNMLKTLSGRMHYVASGLAVIYKDKIYNDVIISKVYFKNLSEEDIKNYIDSGECFGKAGSYAIQGLGASLVDHYEGSLNNIIGLPTERLDEILIENFKDDVIDWIKNYFAENGKGCKAIIGISGGTDSSVVAALCAKALGKENVIGVLMPNGYQHDIDVSKKLVELLDIKYHEINIKNPVDSLNKLIEEEFNRNPNEVDAYKTNTPSRIRMTTLYGVCALYGGRVANTCNLSEDFIGYSTKFGDSAGDFSPISSFTKTEVRKLGKALGLPDLFVNKIPEDGMSGKSDEEKLGFTYDVLDKYIRLGICEDLKIKEKIDYLHRMNLHKIEPMKAYKR